MVKKCSSLALLSVQMKNMSSIYLFSSSGWVELSMVRRLKNTDMKMLATVGENGAPIAVPLCCWDILPAKVKKLLTHKCNRRMIRLGSKGISDVCDHICR